MFSKSVGKRMSAHRSLSAQINSGLAGAVLAPAPAGFRFYREKILRWQAEEAATATTKPRPSLRLGARAYAVSLSGKTPSPLGAALPLLVAVIGALRG